MAGRLQITELKRRRARLKNWAGAGWHGDLCQGSRPKVDVFLLVMKRSFLFPLSFSTRESAELTELEEIRRAAPRPRTLLSAVNGVGEVTTAARLIVWLSQLCSSASLLSVCSWLCLKH